MDHIWISFNCCVLVLVSFRQSKKIDADLMERQCKLKHAVSSFQKNIRKRMINQPNKRRMEQPDVQWPIGNDTSTKYIWIFLKWNFTHTHTHSSLSIEVDSTFLLNDKSAHLLTKIIFLNSNSIIFECTLFLYRCNNSLVKGWEISFPLIYIQD